MALDAELKNEIDAGKFRYFHTGVLSRFEAQPSRFGVEDEELNWTIQAASSEAGWRQVRFDKRLAADGTDLLVPFFGDLAKVPVSEQRHWQEFEVENPALMPLEQDHRFIAAYRQNYWGEFVDWPPSSANSDVVAEI